MNKLNFGIMGAGGIAAHFARAVKLTDCAQVVAVASKDAHRAAAFAKENHIEVSCTYEQLLAREDVQAVYISTTNNFHYENIKACLNHGKHVLCEKAMVMTEAEARELFDLSREKGLFLMEAMWSRFLPSVRKAKEWIESGRIGIPRSVNTVIGFRCCEDIHTRLMDPALGGGSLYDIGVYAIELTTFLVAEPVEDVRGFVRRDSRTGVDVSASMVLRFSSADACVQCLFTANAKEYLIINGERGYIEIPTPHIHNEAFLHGSDRALAEHFKQEFPGGNGFVYEIEEMARCIGEGRTHSQIVPPEATIACAKIFDSLLRE